jgi:hypothetical protein
MSPSVAALVCVEFSRLAVGSSISLPTKMGDVTISTTAAPSVVEIRSNGTPASVGLGVSKGEITLQYKGAAKRLEIDFFAGPSAALDIKVMAKNGSQLDVKSFAKPGSYVFVSSAPLIRSVRAISNNEALIERICFGD